MAAYQSNFARYLLIIFNILFMLIGIAILGSSLYVYQDGSSGTTDFPLTTLIVGMALGGFLIITSFLGFFSIRGRGLMSFYTVLLVALVVAQLIGAFLVYRGTLDTSATLSGIWNGMSQESRARYQDQFMCCGFKDVEDRSVTSSQCPANQETSLPGCYTLLERSFAERQRAIYIALFSFLGIEMLTLLVCSLLLCGACGRPDYSTRLQKASSMNQREASLYA